MKIIKKLLLTAICLYFGTLNVQSQDFPPGATTVPTSREAQVGIGQPYPSSYAPDETPFTEYTLAPPYYNPSSIPLTLFLNNKDQNEHKNFGILRRGVFGAWFDNPSQIDHTWLELG